MKAAVRDVYGSPDVLRLEEVARPTPAPDEVLVRVRAASVNKGDTEILRGEPLWVRLVGFGVTKPKLRILGTNVAGTVEAVGEAVRGFGPGDEIFADLLQSGLGGFAEYVCIPQSAPMIRKPGVLSFEGSATLPEAGFIALQGLRDKARVKAGQHVLINGAGGGAGSFAIQLAKAMGAEVTGVDNADKQDWMRKLGTDHVVDYAREDVTERNVQYDAILDVVGTHSVRAWRRVLAPGGVYLAVGGTVGLIVQALAVGGAISLVGSRKMGVLAVQPSKDDLEAILEVVDAGQVAPTVERSYPLEEVADAMRYVLAGRAKGRVAITM